MPCCFHRGLESFKRPICTVLDCLYKQSTPKGPSLQTPRKHRTSTLESFQRHQLAHHDSHGNHKVGSRPSRHHLTSYVFCPLLNPAPAYHVLVAATAASREAMSEARLPLAYRDGCAGLLIPLNRCRYEEYYLPWKCEVGPTNPRGICEGRRQGER